MSFNAEAAAQILTVNYDKDLLFLGNLIQGLANGKQKQQHGETQKKTFSFSSNNKSNKNNKNDLKMLYWKW
jgi:hypothetical protein